MIASSRSIFVGSAICALGLHVAGMLVLYKPEGIEIAAAGAPAVIKEGNAFADMATGVMTSVETSQAIEAVQPTNTSQTEPAPAPPAAKPVSPTPNDPTTNTSTTAVKVQAGATAVLAAPTPSAAIVVSAGTPIQSAPLTPKVTQSTTPPTATPSVTSNETITAEALAPSAVLTSPRPPQRPEGLAPPPPPTPTPTRADPAPAPRGNATRNASAGAATNTAPTATATSSGSNAQNAAPAPTAANSRDVTNYPGQVMRRISRVRKPRTNVRGAALISFTIANGGGLSGVSVARSSGNAQLDQLAVQVVQRAAPFPAPPSGAQTRYRVEITGR